MKKNNLLLLFILTFKSGFSQTEYFNPLDELGSGYGNRELEIYQNPEINFPSENNYKTTKNNNRNTKKKSKFRPHAYLDSIFNANLDRSNPKNKDYINSESHLRINQSFSDNNTRIRNKSDLLIEVNKENNKYGQITTFNTETTDFQRFKNSPCFDEIGFSPTWDLESLYKSYNHCESEKNKKKLMNILFILSFVVVIAIVLYLSLKKSKNNKNSTTYSFTKHTLRQRNNQS